MDSSYPYSDTHPVRMGHDHLRIADGRDSCCVYEQKKRHDSIIYIDNRNSDAYLGVYN